MPIYDNENQTYQINQIHNVANQLHSVKETIFWKSADLLEGINNNTGVFCLWSNHKTPIKYIKNKKLRNKIEKENRKLNAEGKKTKKYVTYSHYCKSIPEMMGIVRKKPNWNWYMTTNSLSHWHRSSKNVLGLNGIYFDVDCERPTNPNGVSMSDFYINQDAIFRYANLPKPTTFISSGRGFHLLYLFSKQRVVHAHTFLRLWEHLEDKVADRLEKAIEAVCHVKPGDTVVDPKSTDPARVFRMPQTWNIKTDDNDSVTFKRLCQVQYCTGETHGMLDYWVKNYLPKIEYYHGVAERRRYKKHLADKYRKRNKKRMKKTKRSTHRANQHNSLYNRHNFFLCRAKDIESLITKRARYDKAHCKDKNHNKHRKELDREESLFLIATDLSHVDTNKEIEQRIDKDNRHFFHPLDDDEIVKLKAELNHLDFRLYKFKSSRIIDKLNITPAEQKQMQVLKLYKYSARYKREQVRSKKRKIRHRRNSKRMSVISNLSHKNVSQAKISRLTGIPRSTIYRILKKFKKVKLIKRKKIETKCKKIKKMKWKREYIKPLPKDAIKMIKDTEKFKNSKDKTNQRKYSVLIDCVVGYLRSSKFTWKEIEASTPIPQSSIKARKAREEQRQLNVS